MSCRVCCFLRSRNPGCAGSPGRAAAMGYIIAAEFLLALEISSCYIFLAAHANCRKERPMSSSTFPPDAAAALSRRQLVLTFGGLLLAMLLGSLDQTIVATALPTIVGDLG